MLLKNCSTSYEVKTIQNNLKMLGFAPISIDGIAGPNTYNALIEFQRANSLAADGIVGPETKAALLKGNSSSHSTHYNISPDGITFIANYESFYAKPYRGLDSQNQTIGYGHVITSCENFDSLTEAEAKALLKKDLQSFVDSVNTMVSGLNLTQCQFDALLSFAYNCGANALKFSTLLKDIKANASMEKIKEDIIFSWISCYIVI